MPHSRVLITFALPDESSVFRHILRGGRHSQAQIAHVGVGPVAASLNFQRSLAECRPDFVICSGFAGGLDPRLGRGEVVIAGNLSTYDPSALPGITEAVKGCLGDIVSRDTPVESIAAKAAVFQETGVCAVDMESEAIREICVRCGAPLLVLRAISDSAAKALPVPFAEWYDVERQCPRVGGLLRYLAAHPTAIAPFAEFVHGLGAARRALARGLSQVLDGGYLQ